MHSVHARHVAALTLALGGTALLSACFQPCPGEDAGKGSDPLQAVVVEPPADPPDDDPLVGCGCVMADGVVADDPDVDDEDMWLAPEADPPSDCSAERKAVNDCVSREMKKKYPKLTGIPPKMPPDIYNQLVNGPCKAEYDSYKDCIENIPGGPTTPGASHWKPPYHIYYNSCHQAANTGVANGATGVLLCSIGTYYQHHTVNYWQGGCTAQEAANAMQKPADCQKICITNPQVGINAADPGVCCWTQASGTSPNITSGQGETCSKKFCNNQQTGQQVCLPPGIGVVVDLPSDCKDESTGVVSAAACRDCCLREANKIVGPNDQTDPWKQQREQFLKDCNAECDKVTCPNNVNYREKNGVCLPSCGIAGGNTCSATQDGCRTSQGYLSNRFYASYDCNYCCVL